MVLRLSFAHVPSDFAEDGRGGHHIDAINLGEIFNHFLEFEWHVLRMLFEPVNISVYAGHEIPRNLLGILAICRPFEADVAAERNRRVALSCSTKAGPNASASRPNPRRRQRSI